MFSAVVREKVLLKLLAKSDYRQVGPEFNFRCPFCLDSKKDPNKKRFWYNIDKNAMHCFNCDLPEHTDAFTAILQKLAPRSNVEGLVISVMSGGKFSDLLNKAPEVKEEPAVEQNFDEFLKLACFPILETRAIKEIPNSAYDYVAGRLLFKTGYPFYYCADEDSRYHGRMIIPFFNDTGNCVYFQARSLDTNAGDLKYLNPPGGSKALFGVDRIDKSKPVVVLEGPIDSLFVENAVACMTTAISKGQMEKVKDCDLIIMFDNDKPGRDASMKYARKGYRVFLYPKHMLAYKDINEYVKAVGVTKLTFEKDILPYLARGFQAEMMLKLNAV